MFYKHKGKISEDPALWEKGNSPRSPQLQCSNFRKETEPKTRCEPSLQLRQSQMWRQRPRIGKVKGKYLVLIGKFHKHTKHLKRQRHQIMQHTKVFWRKKRGSEGTMNRRDPREAAEIHRKAGSEWPAEAEYCRWVNRVEEWPWMHGRYTIKLQLWAQRRTIVYEYHSFFTPRKESLFLPVFQELVNFFFFFPLRK